MSWRTHFDEVDLPAGRFKKTTVPRFWITDITPDVLKVISASRVKEGVVVVSVQHTTAGIIVNENEPGLLEKDFPEALARLFPDGDFKHDDEERLRQLIHEPKNGVSHLRAMFGTRPDFRGIIHGHSLQLGTWQAIIVMDFDLDGRAGRTVKVHVSGSCRSRKSSPRKK